MKRLFLLIAAFAFASVSCERHEFDETRKLHEHGADHAGAEHKEGHGDAHEAEPAGDKAAH